MAPGISVILLSFNRPHYVKQSINSVLWQTFTDFELMIIENSNDGGVTRSVIEEYTDERIVVHYEDLTDEERHRECIVSVLNNKYIDIAQGKYIFFFCDDDILLPNCLEEYWKFAEANGECNCHGGLLWMNYDGARWGWSSNHEFPNVVFNERVSPSCKLTGGGVLLRRDHIIELGQPYFRQLQPEHCSTADAVFFEDLAKRYPIYPVNQTLGITRFHSEFRSFEFWRNQ